MLLLTSIIISNLSIINGLGVYQVTEPIDHGEGPMWDARTKLLYIVDTYEGRILSYNYLNNDFNARNLRGNTTAIIPSKSNPHLHIVGIDRSIFAIEWDGKGPVGVKKHLVTVSEQFPTSRLNDGKADKSGRLWIGTMGFESPTGVAPNEGILYSISKNNLKYPLSVIQPVTISNGLAWNKANNKFYHIDTPTLRVKEYDYDGKSGNISNPKVVFDVSEHENISGYPDGMTIDKKDNLWIALMHGGVVVNVNPRTSKVLKIVRIPVQRVTSVAWGGPNLDILFVTTSKHGLSPTELIDQPAAGSLFAVVNLGTRGLPMYFADIIDQI